MNKNQFLKIRIKTQNMTCICNSHKIGFIKYIKLQILALMGKNKAKNQIPKQEEEIFYIIIFIFKKFYVRFLF